MKDNYSLYRIIKDYSLDELEERVNKEIPDNPGGVSYSGIGSISSVQTGATSFLFVQAFMRNGPRPS